MVVDVVGYQRVDFPDSKDPSRRVVGYSVYYPEPIRERGEGTAYVKKFVPDDRIVGSVGLGSADFNIQLSMSGKPYVDSFRMLPVESKAAK